MRTAVTRFAKPLLVIVLGLTAIAFSFPFESAASQLVRLGVTLILIGVLWVTALGFSLGTLRLCAAVAVLVIVVLLTDIGGRARAGIEANEYVALRSELEIELGLLRGARTTRGQLTEQLLAAEATYLEAQDAQDRANAAASELAPMAEEQDVAAAYLDGLEQAQDGLQEQIEATSNATTAGWKELDLDEATVDSITDGRADERADEPAAATARVETQKAVLSAEALSAHTEKLLLVLDSPGMVELLGPSTDFTRIEQPAGALLQETAGNDDRPDGCGETLNDQAEDSSFDQLIAQADRCILLCFGNDASATCQPRTAKRILLLGFQDRLLTITEQEDVTESQEALLARLSEIRAELSALDKPISLHRLASDGADAVLGEAVQFGMLEVDQPARLGGWGWLVLTIALIIGYRLLEIANDRRSPGPVKVVAGESPKPSPETLAAADLVRAHLASADLQEPSPLPGGEAVSSISNATEATGVENVLVRFLVSLLQTTAFPRRGVDVTVTAQPGDPAVDGPNNTEANEGDDVSTDEDDDAPASTAPADAVNPEKEGLSGTPPAGDAGKKYRLMVRASTTRRNGLLFSHPFENTDFDEVTFAAAYFAAEQLLDAGWTTPSWLRWSSLDGTALRAYQDVMIEKQGPASLLEPDRMGSRRTRLRRAVAASPGTGAALVALSHEAALDKDFAAALHLLLLARVRHPRFLTVRYRLGVTLSMMAMSLDEMWELPDGDKPSEKANHIYGSIDVLEDLYGGWDSADKVHPQHRADLFLHAAVEELDAVISSVKLPNVLMNARRQDEREYWMNLARSSRRRVALEAAAKSARALAKGRLALLPLIADNHVSPPSIEAARTLRNTISWCEAEHDSALRAAPDDWIVRYNAACISAVQCGEHQRRARILQQQATHIRTSGDSEDPQHLDKQADEQLALAAKHYRAAFDHLRGARYASNGQQLFAQWVFVDPDLRPLEDFAPDSWRDALTALFQISDVPVEFD